MRFKFRRIVGVAVLVAAGVVRGQTAPAGEEPKMVLNYRNLPADVVLSDVTQRLGFVVGKSMMIEANISLVSDKPVGVRETASLINEAMWPLGYRVSGEVRSKPAKTVLWVERRPTVEDPGEMRVWKQVGQERVTSDLPAEMAGVSATATMRLEYRDVSLKTILGDMSNSYGLVVDQGNMPNGTVTLVAPNPVRAGEAVVLASELLATGGHKLQADTMEDAKGGKKTHLRVVESSVKLPKPTAVEFSFDNAPLEAVVAELAKRSGMATSDTAKGAKVTIHETLKVESFGTDVGPVVARLNEVLAPQGCVIEATSRRGAGGTLEPLLAVMSVEEAKRTVLQSAVPFMGPEVTGKEWEGVDMKSNMDFTFEFATVAEMLTEVSKRFGFVAMMDVTVVSRVTIEVPKPLNAVEAVSMVNEVLTPLGLVCVTTPCGFTKGTILRVVPMADAKRYWVTGVFAAAAPPGGAGTNGARRGN